MRRFLLALSVLGLTAAYLHMATTDPPRPRPCLDGRFVGWLLLRPLFRLVAQTDSPELFMAATLLVAAVSLETGLPAAVVRKEPKGHGVGGRMAGPSRRRQCQKPKYWS